MTRVKDSEKTQQNLHGLPETYKFKISEHNLIKFMQQKAKPEQSMKTITLMEYRKRIKDKQEEMWEHNLYENWRD